MTQATTSHYAGIDWASRSHAVCVVDRHGTIRARFQVPNTGKSFAGLVRRLARLGVAGVAIERPDGPLVGAMLAAGLDVVVITPRQVKGLRSRYSSSGAKSDPTDAYLLADTLRTDGHRLAALVADSEPTRVLRALSRTAKTCSRPGSRSPTSSPACWSAAFPAPSACSPTCTRPWRSPSCAATPPAWPPSS